MTSKKPVKKVSNKKYVAVQRLNIAGEIFEEDDVVTVQVPKWMIEQGKVKEDK